MVQQHDSSSKTEPQLAGQVAVVTGSSSGMGRAIALELATAGADVLIHARSNADAAAEVAQRIISLGRRSQVLMQDLADHHAHETFVEQTWKWCGQVDIWINNAGADVLTGEEANWSFEKKLDQLWRVDVMATIRLSKLIGQRMIEHGAGVILNMGWDQADQGMAGDSGEMFAAVKGAIMSFSKSLARSLAPKVRVNCVAPGWIKTAWGENASQYWQDRAMSESLLGRWGTPEDVARVARFLVSSEADYITGQVVAVNGGFKSS